MSDLLIPVILVAIMAFGPAVAGFFLMRRGSSKVLFVIGLVWAALYLAIALPGLSRGRPMAQRNACIANLKRLTQAKSQWAKQAKQESIAIPDPSDLAPLLNGGVIPACPLGGTYTLGPVNEPPRCTHAAKGHRLE